MTIKLKRKYAFDPDHLEMKDQFHTICTDLEPNLHKEPSVIMVTSLAGSQKMINASAYLALAFSEQGKRVLLIDAHLYEPSLHRLFEVDISYGLSNLLLQEQQENKPEEEMAAEHLFFLPAGEPPSDPGSLLRSGSIQQVIDLWKEEYDLILFHTSDYFNKPSAKIIRKYCDSIILFIQEGRDKLARVIDVKKDLEKSNREITGTVVIS